MKTLLLSSSGIEHLMIEQAHRKAIEESIQRDSVRVYVDGMQISDDDFMVKDGKITVSELIVGQNSSSVISVHYSTKTNESIWSKHR